MGSAWGWDMTVVVVRAGGTDRLVQDDKPLDSSLVLADEGAHDLGCPAAQIQVSRAGPSYAWTVEGCGHRAPYIEVERGVSTTQMQGLEGQCVRYTAKRFVRLDVPIGPALQRFDAEYAGPSDPAPDGATTFVRKEGYIAPWAALVQQGAHDLTCPAEDVTPGFWTSGKTTTAVAEGCGQRAVYLPGSYPPYVLASKVGLGKR